MSRFVAFLYRNAKAYKPNASHVGLGVSALQHVIVLRRHKISCELYGANEINDTLNVISKLQPNSIVVIEAFWLVTDNIKRIVSSFPDMEFVVRCHSQIGFLQVEPQAIQLLREQIAYQETETRFRVSGNSPRLTTFISQVYNTPCLMLPNLYDSERQIRRPYVQTASRSIRIGAFGALRNLKMHVTGAAGALEMARRLGKDLEFHITVGRDEGGSSVVAAIRNLFSGLRWARLIENPWTSWVDFKRLVSYMDLCVQTSVTESFNIVTADALAEGVPCIVGPAIDWVPAKWIADIDSPSDVADKLMAAYADPQSSQIGYNALQAYIDASVKVWLAWLGQFS